MGEVEVITDEKPTTSVQLRVFAICGLGLDGRFVHQSDLLWLEGIVRKYPKWTVDELQPFASGEGGVCKMEPTIKEQYK